MLLKYHWTVIGAGSPSTMHWNVASVPWLTLRLEMGWIFGASLYDGCKEKNVKNTILNDEKHFKTL